MPTTTMPTTTATPDRAIRCRYRRRNDELCTAEALDPEGDILICTKHAAEVIRMVQGRIGGGQR